MCNKESMDMQVADVSPVDALPGDQRPGNIRGIRN